MENSSCPAFPPDLTPSSPGTRPRARFVSASQSQRSRLSSHFSSPSATIRPIRSDRDIRIKMRFATRTFLLSFGPLALLLFVSFWAVQVLVQRAVRDQLE